MGIVRNITGVKPAFGSATPTSTPKDKGAWFFVTDTGDSSGQVLESYIYSDNGWVRTNVDSSVEVLFGAVAPTLTDKNSGTEFYVTSDGTSSGTITERYVYDGTDWIQTPVGSTAAEIAEIALPAIANLSEDLSGFVDRTSSDYSFNDITRLYTLSPTGAQFSIWVRGVEYVITSALTLTIDATAGGRYIHFNPTTQALEEVLPVGSHPSIKGEALVAYIYWDGSEAIILGDERHSVSRDTQWHYNQHMDVGAIWRDGGAIQYTAQDDSATTISFSNPIKLADEDIEHTITHSTTPSGHYQQQLEGPGVIPTLYLNGTTYTQVFNTPAPFVHSGNVAVYNQITGGVGSLVQLANSTFVNYWVLLSNDSINPVKLVMGRQEHSTVAEAEAETFDAYGLSLPEMVISHKIVCYYKSSHLNNDARVWIEKVYTLVSDQNQSSVFSTTAHQNLTGTSLSDSHPIEAITGLRAELDAKLETETTTTLALNTNSLDYTDETGTVTNIDLSAYDNADTIAELTDTDVTTNPPNDFDTLVYDSTSSKWVPAYLPKVVKRADIIVSGTLMAQTGIAYTAPAEDYFNGSMSYNTDGSVFAVAAGGTANTSNSYNVYTTADSGSTWTDSGTTLEPAYPAPLFPVSSGYVTRQAESLNIGYYSADLSLHSVAYDDGIDRYGVGVRIGGTDYAVFGEIVPPTNNYHTANGVIYSSDGVTWYTNTSMVVKYSNGTLALSSNGQKIYGIGVNGDILVWTSMSDTSPTTIPYSGGWVTGFYASETHLYFVSKFETPSRVFKVSLTDGTATTVFVSTSNHTNLGPESSGLLRQLDINHFVLPIDGGNYQIFDMSTDTVTDTGIACVAGTIQIMWSDYSGVGKLLEADDSTLKVYTVTSPTAGVVLPEYTVDDLDDTSVTNKIDGQVLTWDATSSKWVNRSVAGNLADLDDTNVGTKTDKGALIWDSATSKWISASFPIGEPIFCNVKERWDDADGTSVVCDNEAIFHLNMGSYSSNLSVDIMGLNLAPYLSTTVTFVCDNQAGGTSHIVNGITIEGNAVNLFWQGGTQPVGTQHAHDVVTFSIMMMPDNSYKVFGNLVSYS